MKAAVMFPGESLPVYMDMPDPAPANVDGLQVRVKAVALKHFDKSRASGTHYSSSSGHEKNAGRVIGGDGVCLLEDGTRVYGMGITGMLAEKALIDKRRIVKLPDTLDDAAAAALPNAVIGSAMALRFKAEIKAGDVVLINGATGFTGRVAVQIAKQYGAGKIIVTGRDQRSLDELLTLGADKTISVLQDDAAFISQISGVHAKTPVDIIVDYLWGHTAEMIFSCIKGNGSFGNRVRYVSVGSATGDTMQLSAAVIRSSNIQLTGSGLGAWTKQQVNTLFADILPEMFVLAATGRLVTNVVSIPLAEIVRAPEVDLRGGQRLVVTI